MLRVLLYLIITPILLILAAAFIIPLFLDEDKLLAIAAEALEKQTGATLTVGGEAKLSLFPRIAMQLNEAELSLAGEGQPDLSARSLDIAVQLMPLFSGSVEIEGLAIKGLLVNVPPAPKRPEIDTSDMSDAELDLFYAARRKALSEAGTKRGASAALALPMALEVDRLSITNSRVVLLAKGPAAPTVIDIKALKAKHLNLDGEEVPLSLSLSILGAGDSEPVKVELESSFTVDSEGQQLALSSLSAVISGASAEPIRLSATGDASLEQMTADLAMQVDIGQAHGSGTLRYASFSSPQIDADLHFNQLNPALLALAGSNSKDPKQSDQDARDGDAPLPLAGLRSIDSRAQLRIDKAIIDGYEIDNLNSQLRVSEGIVKINRLSGQLYGGELALEATFNAKHNRAKLNTQGSITGVDIAQLLQALKSEPLATGKVSMNWQFASAGTTSNALRDKLNGPLSMHTSDLVLKDIGIEKMLCETVALANRESLSSELATDSAFEALTVDIKVEEGKARLAPLRGELQHLALKGTGDLDLKSLKFDAKFKARIAEGLSELDPACRIHQRYTAIDWPLECEGELGGKPSKWCSVDSGEILEELAKNEVKRKLGQEAGRLLDRLRKQD